MANHGREAGKLSIKYIYMATKNICFYIYKIKSGLTCHLKIWIKIYNSEKIQADGIAC